jgi:hypothetical protein
MIEEHRIFLCRAEIKKDTHLFRKKLLQPQCLQQDCDKFSEK